MLVRIKQTNQVLDLDAHVAANFLNSGRAEVYLPPQREVTMMFRARETAARWLRKAETVVRPS